MFSGKKEQTIFKETNFYWQTSQRQINCVEKTLVMAILNVTPDSFSDGGKFYAVDEALKQAEIFIAEGADVLDIGGESTRPNAVKVSVEEEIRRVVPVVEAVKKRFDIPISIDTSKSKVAAEAVAAGAEIINDISGLRFDERIADVAAKHKTGLILMFLRGTFETMHEKIETANIIAEVAAGFRQSIETAQKFNVKNEQIALDVGIGFSKTLAQNLEILAKLDKLVGEFQEFPMLVGTSRKSFLGKITNDAPPEKRLAGSLASASVAAWHGAKIVRVHDVKATVEALKVIEAIKLES